ncbi:hypothetical protein [Bacillus thuringiensis]|uniref:hypothetical protein n=1 Tax=Bacillus thuringiensis TaxID=1428 RepID=UPI0016514551|nr:hypothetical protein [Bacillus thuringiensis]
MMEYLLSLLQDLLKVFLTILVTGYGNKLVSNISKNVKEPPYAVGSKREVLEKENNFI